MEWLWNLLLIIGTAICGLALHQEYKLALMRSYEKGYLDAVKRIAKL